MTTPKLCLVTGATGGLGQAVAVALARHGASVVLGCRDTRRGEQARGAVQAVATGAAPELMTIDLASLASVRQAAAAFAAAHDRLDVLIHSAGVFRSRREITPDGLEAMFAVNHLGPFLLTQLLRPQLSAGAPARVWLVSAPATTQLNFDDLQGAQRFSAYQAFGASKMANLLFAYALARRREGQGIHANAFHPGLLKTNLMQAANPLLRWLLRAISASPARAAEALADLALAPQFADTNGQFYTFLSPLASNAYSHDQAVQDRLWEVSLQLTGLA
jgi:NAD(P)-dependent dehydrogenase (short-subunit alcohol dehydrogenase family)